MTSTLGVRIGAALDREVHPQVAAFAASLALEENAAAVLFYGSNLRTGSLEGVLDFYVLLPGGPEKGVWPRVSYRERSHGGQTLRAKIATMTVAKFRAAAAGRTIDTTIWSRFVQPSTLVWHRGATERALVTAALEQAAITAARLAAAIGPDMGSEAEFWRALFRATYRAELRVEQPGRENSILEANVGHFDGLLPAALAAAAIPVIRHGDTMRPVLAPAAKRRILRSWSARRRLGKPLNVVRLLRASGTFEGAARYAAWKVERHTGVVVEVTPWRERHPVLAAPGVFWNIWRARKRP